MTLRMYAIKDRLNGFTTPIPFSMDEVAERWFHEMRTENTTMKLSPNDFGLWYMGTFDTETGKYESEVKEVVYGKIDEN